MASTLPFQDQCCTPCDEVPVVNIPGATGADGTDGSDGAAGTNAFTTTTADFVMPAVSGTVSVSVGSTLWATVGQPVFVQTAGFMRVQSKTSSTVFVLYNYGYTGNAAPATNITSGSQISPSGIGGGAGTIAGTAAGGDLKGTYVNPTLSKPNTLGGLIAGNGTDAVDFPKGTNNYVLHVDTGVAATNLAWKQVNLTAAVGTVTGTLPLANGGTGQITKAAAFYNLSPMSAVGDIITATAASTPGVVADVAVGNVLRSGGVGVIPNWGKVGIAHLDAAMGLAPIHLFIARYSIAAGGVSPAITTDGAWHVIPIAAPAIADTTFGVAWPGANTLSLPIGFYRVMGWCTFYDVTGPGTLSVRLQDVTSGVTLVDGGTLYMQGYGINQTVMLTGYFQISASAKNVEFQYESDPGGLTNYFGTTGAVARNVIATLQLEFQAATT